MTSNFVNSQPYLPTSRKYPSEIGELSYQVNISYVDIAKAVNERTIGVYPTVNPAITGNKYYINTGRTQQEFRKVFTFTSTTSITHNISFNNLDQFTLMYGSYTDGTNWYGLPAGTSVAVAGLITFYVSPTQIVFQTGAGAPALTRGSLVLSWIAPA